MLTITTAVRRSLVGVLIAATSTSCVTQVVQAPTPDVAPEPVNDPPARVGRLALISGSLSFLAAGDSAWAPADLNRPVTTGDALWSDNMARAEVELGSAELRLGSTTQVSVERLDDAAIQVSVPQGSAILHLRALAPDETDEVDAPNAAIAFGTAGEYRVDVSPDGATTTITVFSGAAQVTAGGASFPVNAPQVATVRGESGATYSLAYIGPLDDFSQWSQARNAMIAAADARAANYVSPDMPGVADLATYGQWDEDATEGPIWYPREVPPGWAPYRNGHWVWVSRWGWTWVDDAPWGFAPFHYGRWANVRGRWGWTPGREIAPPVYAPALVVFVGGNGWNASRFGGSGGVGWFPLGPREVYRPPYATSPGYVQRVNVTNVTKVTNVTNVTNVTYRNRSQPGAVTTVSQTTFVNGYPVSRGVVRVPPQEISRAPIVGRAPVVPTRVSLVGEGAAARHAALPPAALQRRPVVAVHEPPPAPVPFSVQQHTLATTAGAPLTSAQVEQLRREAPAVTMPVRVRAAATPVQSDAPVHAMRPGAPDVHPVTVAQPVPPPAIERVPEVPARQPATSVERVPEVSARQPAPVVEREPAPAARTTTRSDLGGAARTPKMARPAKPAKPGNRSRSATPPKKARAPRPDTHPAPADTSPVHGKP